MKRMMWLNVGILSIMLALLGTAYAEKPVTLELTRDGKPAATIVVAEKPTRAAQLAAAELQEHVRKISGATLPMVSDTNKVEGLRILVGESKATQALGLQSKDFKPQEYLIRFQPDVLVLMGRDKEDYEKLDYNNPDGKTIPNGFDEQATCYAVYDFLERHCGTRWYLPTDLGVVYSPNSTLRVTGAERRRTPWMEIRTAVLEPYPSHLPFTSYYRFPNDLIGTIYSGDAALLPWREQALFARRLRHGGIIEGRPFGDHSFYGYYARFWEQDKDPARAKLFEGHRPELFAQGYEGKPPQLCYSSEALVQQTAKDARTFFDGHWKGTQDNNEGWIGQDFFPIGALDNGSWCKCPECSATLAQGIVGWEGSYCHGVRSSKEYLLKFVNRVAREVRKTHPGKMISTYDYGGGTYPSKLEKLEPNVALGVVLNPRRMWNTLEWNHYLEVFDAWDKDSRERPKYLWMHYLFPLASAAYANPYPYIDKPPAWYPFPGFFAHKVVEQMAIYRHYGYRGMTIEISCAPPHVQRLWLWDQLELYVTFQLADDPEKDGNKLIDEFFQLYYGAAAKPMQAFYEMVEEIHCNPNNYSYLMATAGNQDEKIAWEYLGTEPRMDKLERLMKEAKALAQAEPEKARVALFDQSIWQVMLKGRSMYLEKKPKTDAPMQFANAPRVAVPAGHDPRKVDWSKTWVLGNWSAFDGKATARRIEGRVAHDGERLYLRLQEQMDTARIVRDKSLSVYSGDSWEVFISGKRAAYGSTYRQLAVDVFGRTEFMAYGTMEAGNFVGAPPAVQTGWDSGAQVYSDAGAQDCWSVYVALPLEKLLAGTNVKAGDTIYLNVVRATQGKVEGAAMWIPTLAATFHATDRLGRIVLEKDAK